LCTTANFAVLLASINIGMGHHSTSLSPAFLAEFKHLSLLSSPLQLAEITFLKLGIVSMYMRANYVVQFSRHRGLPLATSEAEHSNFAWKWLLRSSFALTLLICGIQMVLHLTECVPMRFMGLDSTMSANRLLSSASCRSPSSVKTATLVIELLSTISALQLFVLPICILLYGIARRNKHPLFGYRPWLATLPYKKSGEEAALWGLAVVGWIGLSAGACRFITFDALFTSKDVTWVSVPWRFCGFAETCIGAIGAHGAVVVLRLSRWRARNHEIKEGEARRIRRLRRKNVTNSGGVEEELEDGEKTPIITYMSTEGYPHPALHVAPDSAAPSNEQERNPAPEDVPGLTLPPQAYVRAETDPEGGIPPP
jgi:hypothetical protein